MEPHGLQNYLRFLRLYSDTNSEAKTEALYNIIFAKDRCQINAGYLFRSSPNAAPRENPNPSQVLNHQYYCSAIKKTSVRIVPEEAEPTFHHEERTGRVDVQDR
jgi:hypothetical protein